MELDQLTLSTLRSDSPDLREKFIKAESELFRLRFETDDIHERDEFVRSLKFGWTSVSTITFWPFGYEEGEKGGIL